MKLKNKYNFESNKEIYDFWKKHDFFSEYGNKDTKTMILPPPNVTGKLHLGHAWDGILPDFMYKYWLIKGHKVKWYPGMDHAGIATQAKVEKRIFEEENKTKYDYGREKFIDKVWEWKGDYSKQIHDQWENLGFSLNYKYEKFTLDKDVNKYVEKAFIKLHKEGAIYKAKKMINWDPILKTAISNIEIERENKKDSKMYNIRYQIKGKSDYLVIATTRPETMFGDTAVFVNPDDDRYKKYIGKTVINPSNNKEIPILSDKYVEFDFGTGVMKCTPAHDFNDYDLGIKHNLQMIEIMDENAKLNNNTTDEFIGLDRYVAREKLISKLKDSGNLDGVETHENEVTVSQRSGAIVEPMLSLQWFMDISKISKNALKLSEKGDINFYPFRFETEFKNWMIKADAWCISRQLWWGHQIPAWYKEDDILKEKPIVSIDSPGKDYIQDDDVLDTWFSSALWPIIMTGNHEKKPNDSLPTSLLVTGYDLIFFWISKMIFMSTELKGKVPFNDILIHGLIRDKNGKKMSKSLGNGVDPMEVIGKYGNDSLRWFLLSGSAPGNDLRFDDKKLLDSNNFINKWYNVAKFTATLASEKEIRELSIKDIKLDNKIDIQTYQKISQLESKIESWLLDNSSNKYNISLLAREVYDFYWNIFANNYLELSKYSSDWKPFVFAFKKLNQMLSPFLPFVCEEIYQSIFRTKKDDSVFLYKDFSDKSKFSKIVKEKEISKIDIFKLIDFWSADIDKVMNFTKFHVKDVSFEIIWDDKKSSEILSKYISRKKSTVFANNNDNSLVWQSMDEGTVKLFSIDKKEVNKSINNEINTFLFNKYENELKRSEKIINNKMIKSNKPDLYNLELSKYNYFKMLLNK